MNNLYVEPEDGQANDCIAKLLGGQKMAEKVCDQKLCDDGKPHNLIRVEVEEFVDIILNRIPCGLFFDTEQDGIPIRIKVEPTRMEREYLLENFTQLIRPIPKRPVPKCSVDVFPMSRIKDQHPGRRHKKV